MNASAETVERQGDAAMRDALASAFERHGISAALEFVSGTELRRAAERALRQAAARELDAIVVCGGDGSVRTVAGVLAGTGIPLGIVPFGTLNHFARDLRIPVALDEAVAVIAARDEHAVDVGEVNGATFINNCSIGIYPYLVLERERRRRRHGLSKWTAMALAALRVLRYLPLRRLSIRGQGWVESVRSPAVFVGNNEYQLAAPAVGRRERLDRGELCLYVARAKSRLSLFWLACRCILGRVAQARDLRTFKLSAVEISAHRHRLLVALDGEVEVIRSPLQCRSRPGALRVFVPPANRVSG